MENLYGRSRNFFEANGIDADKKKGYSSDVSRRSYIHALTTFCAPKKPTEQSWAEVKNYFQHITCRKLIQL